MLASYCCILSAQGWFAFSFPLINFFFKEMSVAVSESKFGKLWKMHLSWRLNPENVIIFCVEEKHEHFKSMKSVFWV